jgi:hypothetical protein
MTSYFDIKSCASDESETRVESHFLTTFKAPEFSGRIRTELLPSSDFLSYIAVKSFTAITLAITSFLGIKSHLVIKSYLANKGIWS